MSSMESSQSENNRNSTSDSAYRSDSRSNSMDIEQKLVSILVDGDRIDMTFEITNDVEFHGRDSGSGFCQFDSDKVR